MQKIQHRIFSVFLAIAILSMAFVASVPHNAAAASTKHANVVVSAYNVKVKKIKVKDANTAEITLNWKKSKRVKKCTVTACAFKKTQVSRKNVAGNSITFKVKRPKWSSKKKIKYTFTVKPNMKDTKLIKYICNKGSVSKTIKFK